MSPWYIYSVNTQGTAPKPKPWVISRLCQIITTGPHCTRAAGDRPDTGIEGTVETQCSHYANTQKTQKRDS